MNPPHETTDPKVLLDATPAASCVKRHASRLATANLAAPDGDTTDIPSPSSRADRGLMGRWAWAAPRR